MEDETTVLVVGLNEHSTKQLHTSLHPHFFIVVNIGIQNYMNVPVLFVLIRKDKNADTKIIKKV